MKGSIAVYFLLTAKSQATYEKKSFFHENLTQLCRPLAYGIERD
jgi:hypothetical protein